MHSHATQEQSNARAASIHCQTRANIFSARRRHLITVTVITAIAAATKITVIIINIAATISTTNIILIGVTIVYSESSARCPHIVGVNA